MAWISASSPVLANIVYTYADIQRCMYPQVNAPCVANATEQDYPSAANPLRNPETGATYKGCYDRKFQRRENIPPGGKCTSANAPIRVEVKYFLECSFGATCITGSRVVVRPKIFGDSGDVITLKMTGSKGDNISGGLEPIILDPAQSGDPAYDSCRAIKEMGYNWDPVNRECQIDPSRQCQRLGFVWENDRCINKCDESQCNKKFCTGYVYQPDDLSCVCMGTSTTSDLNDSPCIETTATPSPTPPACSSLVTIVNSEKGQTEVATMSVGGIAQSMNIGGNKNRSMRIDCSKSVTSVSLTFSDVMPAMCIRCGDGNTGEGGDTCGYSLSTTTPPTCTIPSGYLVDGRQYYIFTYPQGAAPAPTPSALVIPASSPTPSPIPTPSIPVQDISVNSITIASTPHAADQIRSGITTATVTVLLGNTSNLPATVDLTLSGPISACIIPTPQTIPANSTLSVTSPSCVLSGHPGKHCARASVEFYRVPGSPAPSEDSDTGNNRKAKELQIYPKGGEPETVGSNACK